MDNSLEYSVLTSIFVHAAGNALSGSATEHMGRIFPVWDDQLTLYLPSGRQKRQPVCNAQNNRKVITWPLQP